MSRVDITRERSKRHSEQRHQMNETTQKWFNDWANDYDRMLGDQKRHHAMLDLAVQMSKVKDGEHVFDIGCGTGLLSLKFLQAVNCTVSCIDLAEDMIELCKNRMEDLNLASRVTIKQGDIADLEFEDSTFDIVASTVTLHHLKDKQPTINKIYRILKPGGRFVLGDIDVNTTGDLKDVQRLV
jgi:ubiquinone/menaquinone biosynthesis C-methylase UbiE